MRGGRGEVACPSGGHGHVHGSARVLEGDMPYPAHIKCKGKLLTPQLCSISVHPLTLENPFLPANSEFFA